MKSYYFWSTVENRKDLWIQARPSIRVSVCVCVRQLHDIAGTPRWIILKFWVMLGKKSKNHHTATFLKKFHVFSKTTHLLQKKRAF